MANFLDAVIQSGPNAGMRIRDLLAANYVGVDGVRTVEDIRREVADEEPEVSNGNG